MSFWKFLSVVILYFNRIQALYIYLYIMSQEVIFNPFFTGNLGGMII